jgi:hypothetical protein
MKKLSVQKAADDAEKLSKASNSREFRDALTRANGAVQGIRTNALQWMGTSGSK